MTAVAIIFDNFGPYHIARLDAAAKVCDLLAIEVATTSGTYAWENDASAGKFRRTTLFSEGTSDEINRVELFLRLERALGDFKPSLVIVPGWASPAAWGAMRWCLGHRVPMVCMSESTEWDERRVGWKEAIKSKMVRLFSSALVGGKRHAEYLEKLGMPTGRIAFGYDAVDNRYFEGAADEVRADEEGYRSRFQLPPRYFLASARFVEKKNLARLLNAYALYRKASATDPWSLVLLGDGRLRGELESKRESLGLLEHVSMPGFKQIEELPTYYSLAGAFVHASTVEPWGLVVNEAMASGLPVLVSNRCGCVEELVKEGVNGFTFDPLRVEEIAERMQQVAAESFPRTDYGRKSREIVAGWGPGKFAEGLSQAVTIAMQRPAHSPTLLDQGLLWMISRQ
jgi:glycosyltransferase involved in cell wall biosynthesis